MNTNTASLSGSGRQNLTRQGQGASNAKIGVASGDVLQQLRDIVYSGSGIDIPQNKAYLLKDRLRRRLKERGFSGYDEYLFFLKYDPKKEEEMIQLINIMTTNETSFFRDMSQLEAFRQGVLPDVLNRKNGGAKKLRVWSAGCSTGEEPYTLAMIIASEGLPSRGWRVQVDGTDINTEVLNSARRGVYGEYAVRNTPKSYFSKYFSNGCGRISINSEIKRMVKFCNLNLFDTLRLRAFRDMDVIFFRNVMIYFDEKGKKRVIGHLYDSLAPNGYLIIGFSESLFNITRAFKPVGINKCIVYKKI